MDGRRKQITGEVKALLDRQTLSLVRKGKKQKLQAKGRARAVAFRRISRRQASADH
jgi:hypothetical protein